jgi:hypothetical protein
MTLRDRLLLGAVLSAILIALAYLEIVSPHRSDANKLADQVTAAQDDLASANAQVATARANQAGFKRNYAAVASLGEAVPADDDVPTLIVQLQSAASHSHVNFLGLNVGSGSATPAATATAGATPASNLPPDATVGPAGLPVMSFTFTFRGSFFRLSDFFNRVQRFVIAGPRSISVSGRLMTLNSISLAPAPAGFPQVVATVAATGYLTPASQGLTAGATPAGPATAQTTTAGASSSAPAAAISTPVK